MRATHRIEVVLRERTAAKPAVRRAERQISKDAACEIRAKGGPMVVEGAMRNTRA